MAQSLPPHSTFTYKHIGDQEVCFDFYPPSTVDAYTEPNEVRLVSAVVYFHAGGLPVGSKESWFPFWLHRRTVDSGIAFLCPDYQLLPPATGHDVLSDIQDFLLTLCNQKMTFTLPESQHQISYKVDTDALVLAGSSAGGLCAYLAANGPLKPRALLSLYGMGGDFMTPYWMEPKDEVFIPGREILDPGHFDQFIYPFSLPVTTQSALQYHPADHPTPGLPENPRMYLARLYCQLGTYLDYYTGEHEPSLSETLRRRRRTLVDAFRENNVQAMVEEWGGPLVPKRHHSLFPQLSVNSEWPEVFMIHGTQDYHVPFHESQHLKELLEKANVKVTLRAVVDRGHSFDYDPKAEQEHGELFNEVADFLKRVLNCSRR